MKRTKCIECGCDLKYKVVEENYVYEEDNLRVEYKGKKAICENCGKEISIDEIEDYNQEQFEKAYKEMNDIITVGEINEILEKYNIGKRPLSVVLGFGEITITRYLEGFIPTPKNSKYLKKILKTPAEYYAMLIKNGSRISKTAFKKSKECCEKMLDMNNKDNTIIDVSNYIGYNYKDTTPLRLQKLLYYIQMFGLAFLGKPIFYNECKAWDHGPVYSEAYFEFKNNGRDPIVVNKCIELNVDEDSKKIIDSVLQAFACYSGEVLTYFTHSEVPWNKAKDEGMQIVDREDILNQGKKIIHEYKINNADQISKYSEKMFKKYKIMLSKGV